MNFLAILDAFAIVVSQPLDQGTEGSLLAVGVFLPPPESCIDGVQAYLHIVRASVLMGWDTVFWSLDLDLYIFRTAGGMHSNRLYNKISPAGSEYVLR